MFNVTLLTDRANKKFKSKENDYFKTLALDYDANDVNGPEGALMSYVFKHVSWYTKTFINNKEDNELLRQMRALNLDGSITLQLPSEMIL